MHYHEAESMLVIAVIAVVLVKIACAVLSDIFGQPAPKTGQKSPSRKRQPQIRRYDYPHQDYETYPPEDDYYPPQRRRRYVSRPVQRRPVVGYYPEEY